MAFMMQNKPQPLGNILVPTPGTPVPLTYNLPNLTPPVCGAVTDHVPFNKLSLISSPITHTRAGNTGICYIGISTMVKATLAGVIGIISPGGSFSMTTNVDLNTYALEQLYVDADTANDGLFGSVDVI